MMSAFHFHERSQLPVSLCKFTIILCSSGFMYIGEMLKEWRTNKVHATLEQLLTEASSEHLLWEAERANKELVML